MKLSSQDKTSGNQQAHSIPLSKKAKRNQINQRPWGEKQEQIEKHLKFRYKAMKTKRHG